MTNTPAIAADSREGRLLLALRRGPHEPGELAEQFGNLSGLQGQLVRAGLIAYDGDFYTLTEAGRAACPFRNPLAAKPATPEVFIMPKGETKLTRQKVLDAIVAAGPGGITRKALVDKFAHLVKANAVDNHILSLDNASIPVVFRPERGLIVAVQFNDQQHGETVAPKIAPETASTATDDWIPEPLATDPVPAAPVVYAVENLDVEQITARPVVFDTELDDPDQVEFCIYSSGGFDMLTDQGTISLAAPVFKKLRTFFGILAEAA